MRSSLYGAHSRDDRGANGASHAEEEILRENEALLDVLAGTVGRMKASAGNLRDEAAAQNKLLRTVSGAFDRASSGVYRSARRIEGVMQRYGCRHVLLIGASLFLVVLFLCYMFR